jgi:hypothetical protein
MKARHEFKAPLGNADEPTEPFQITSMDMAGSYCLAPSKNEYLLTFVDHFTKFAEDFLFPDRSAETYVSVSATQIIARHESESTSTTDQGRAFISNFCNETCNILIIEKVQTSAYHPVRTGVVERFQKSLHDGMSHYINSASTNMEAVVPFYLMAHRATPHRTVRIIYCTGEKVSCRTRRFESQITRRNAKIQNTR